MASFNKVVLMGNLTRDVELRQLPSGASVANLGMAVNESFTDKAGERRETTVYVDVEVWGRQAETCSKYLSKGRQVLVDGRLKLDQWQDKEGNNRSRLGVKASNVTFIDSKRDTAQDDTSAIPTNPPSPSEPPATRGNNIEYPPEWDDIEIPPFG